MQFLQPKLCFVMMPLSVCLGTLTNILLCVINNLHAVTEQLETIPSSKSSVLYPNKKHLTLSILQNILCLVLCKGKGKGLTQQAEVAQGIPGKLRPWIFLMFGTTRVVGRQPYAPAVFTSRRNAWCLFLEAKLTPGHTVLSVTTEKIPSDTTRNRSRGCPTSSAGP